MKQIEYDIIEACAHQDSSWFTMDSSIDEIMYLCKPKEIITMFIDYYRETLTQYMIRSLFMYLYDVQPKQKEIN